MAGNTARNRVTGAGLRVSDAERDTVAEELARHLQDGRLDAAEFDERVGRAMTARTQGDLDGLLEDLPHPAPEPPPAVRPRLGWPFPLVPVAVVLLFVAIAGAAGGGPEGHEHPVWALWWLVWLIPAAVFAVRRRLRRAWPKG
jgi:Domain of unknown function (DUF1707)